MSKKVIGVTDCSKYDSYANWISTEGDVEVVKISYKDEYKDDLQRCDAFLLTGGEDVHPRFYKKPEYLPYCHQFDIDERRDELEFRVLEFSQQHRKPLLGICRGLQVANVFFGGTLIPDIPSFGKFNHSRHQGNDRYHPVTVDTTSYLHSIVGTNMGEVNSAHHQSAEIVAADLVASMLSLDGVVEALEWRKPEGKPYLMLVQWHPERMKDQRSPFSENIKKSFLQAI